MATRERKTNYDFGRLDYDKIDSVIKENPKLSWPGIEVILKDKGIKCSQYSYFARKAKLEGRKFDVKKQNRKKRSYQFKTTIEDAINKIVPKSKMKDEYLIVAKELSKNPTASHAQLKKDLNIKMCDANFYQFRIKFNKMAGRIKLEEDDNGSNGVNIKNFKGDSKKFLKILEKEGKITVDEACKKMRCSRKIIYGVAFRLRKKLNKNGVELAYEDDFYFIKSGAIETVPSTVPQVRKTTQPNGGKTSFNEKGSLNDLRELPGADLDDYLDTMKKSIFYGLSAQAIITANKIVKAKKEEVNNII